jgi:hypothetical protein
MGYLLECEDISSVAVAKRLSQACTFHQMHITRRSNTLRPGVAFARTWLRGVGASKHLRLGSDAEETEFAICLMKEIAEVGRIWHTRSKRSSHRGTPCASGYPASQFRVLKKLLLQD